MINRRLEGSEPMMLQQAARMAGPQEERRVVRSGRLAVGSMACPVCDAPVMPDGPVRPAEPIACPFCDHSGRVREFLSLTSPSRPARVAVTVVDRFRGGARHRPLGGAVPEA